MYSEKSNFTVKHMRSSVFMFFEDKQGFSYYSSPKWEFSFFLDCVCASVCFSPNDNQSDDSFLCYIWVQTDPDNLMILMVYLVIINLFHKVDICHRKLNELLSRNKRHCSEYNSWLSL